MLEEEGVPFIPPRAKCTTMPVTVDGVSTWHDANGRRNARQGAMLSPVPSATSKYRHHDLRLPPVSGTMEMRPFSTVISPMSSIVPNCESTWATNSCMPRSGTASAPFLLLASLPLASLPSRPSPGLFSPDRVRSCSATDCAVGAIRRRRHHRMASMIARWLSVIADDLLPPDGLLSRNMPASRGVPTSQSEPSFR